jgi:membrane protein
VRTINAISLASTFTAIAFVLVALGAVVVIPVVLNYLLLSDFADLLVRTARWPAMFIVLALPLACICRFGPSREAPRWRWFTWGSVGATILWPVTPLCSQGLRPASASSRDLRFAGSGERLHDMALDLSHLILLGAELNAEMEHQTAHDTTTGAPKPLAARGAKMADSVAAGRTDGRVASDLGSRRSPAVADCYACFAERQSRGASFRR